MKQQDKNVILSHILMDSMSIDITVHIYITFKMKYHIEHFVIAAHE